MSKNSIINSKDGVDFMKFILCFSCLFLFSGCAKVADFTSSKMPEIETTGDPIYDTQTETQILLPWTWFL